MSDEWKSGGPNLAAARNKRAERAQPELVKEAISKLGVMKDMRPEFAPVVDVALGVVKAAQAEVEALEDRVAIAEERARLAEALVANVQPTLDELEARADAAESQLAARETIESERQTEKAAERVEISADSVRRLTARVDALLAAPPPQPPEFELLRAIHRHVINFDVGKSAIACMAEAGDWRVVNADGDAVEMFDSRRAAIKFVREALDAQKAAESHDDALDSPRAARRKKQPGEEHVDHLPAPPAAVDHGPSKRATKRPRIL